MSKVLKKYSAVSGNATRSEYWGVLFITWALSIALSVLSLAIVESGTALAVIVALLLLAGIIFLFWISLATTIRRCRDAGINPWFILLMLIPYVGFVVAIVFGCLPTKSLTESEV